jgi:hypothetical protein
MTAINMRGIYASVGTALANFAEENHTIGIFSVIVISA